MPDTDNPNKLPTKRIIVFLDYIYKYKEQLEAKILSEFITCPKTIKIYIGQYSGYDICFYEVPLGASASVKLVDHLFLAVEM